jgi:hypothetical protein
MKPVVKLAFLAAVLLILGGCQFWGPVTINPLTQTVSIYDNPGYAVAMFTIAADGDVTVDFGDGTEEIYRVNSSLPIEHRYYSIGLFSVLASKGNQSDRAEVRVEVAEPVVDVPFFLNRWFEETERITFNIPRRYHGCAGSMFRTGILGGTGTTEFRMTAYDDQGGKISLFDPDGNNVWGEWVVLIDEPMYLQIITCWVLWGGDTPPYPMAAEKGCGYGDPTCGGCVIDPWLPPEIPEDAPRINFTLQARNQYMLFEDDYPSVSWSVAIKVGTCE